MKQTILATLILLTILSSTLSAQEISFYPGYSRLLSDWFEADTLLEVAPVSALYWPAGLPEGMTTLRTSGRSSLGDIGWAAPRLSIGGVLLPIPELPGAISAFPPTHWSGWAGVRSTQVQGTPTSELLPWSPPDHTDIRADIGAMSGPVHELSTSVGWGDGSNGLRGGFDGQSTSNLGASLQGWLTRDSTRGVAFLGQLRFPRTTAHEQKKIEGAAWTQGRWAFGENWSWAVTAIWQKSEASSLGWADTLPRWSYTPPLHPQAGLLLNRLTRRDAGWTITQEIGCTWYDDVPSVPERRYQAGLRLGHASPAWRWDVYGGLQPSDKSDDLPWRASAQATWVGKGVSTLTGSIVAERDPIYFPVLGEPVPAQVRGELLGLLGFSKWLNLRTNAGVYACASRLRSSWLQGELRWAAWTWFHPFSGGSLVNQGKDFGWSGWLGMRWMSFYRAEVESRVTCFGGVQSGADTKDPRATFSLWLRAPITEVFELDFFALNLFQPGGTNNMPSERRRLIGGQLRISL